jgi:hypothetical protein
MLEPHEYLWEYSPGLCALGRTDQHTCVASTCAIIPYVIASILFCTSKQDTTATWPGGLHGLRLRPSQPQHYQSRRVANTS